jgi:DNA-binding SARP family transcriptional activator
MAIEFRVLGPLEVWRDGQPVTLGSRKQRALLMSFLLRPGQTVPVDRLADELWAGRPPPGAKASLHSYISRLRTALEDPDATLLRTREGGYELAVDADAIDAHRFAGHTAEARRLLAEGRAGEAGALLETALDLWRGQALAEVADEPFAQPEIARLERLRLAGEEDAVDALLAQGQHAEALARLEPLLDANPLTERLQAQRLLALYRSGRQTEALQRFHAYRQQLVDELGLDPGPELQQLAKAVLHHDPELQAPARVATAAGPARRRIVGRDRELARLDDALAGASRGAGGVVILGGDPGIGKTRLLEELASRGQHLGAGVIWGRCHEGGGAPAFWPWMQVLRAVCGQADAAALTDLVGDDAAILVHLVPELGARLGVTAQPLAGDLEAERFALYQAVVGVLSRLAERQFTIVLLEDLHWADRLSLELLVMLTGTIAAHRLLVAATHRDSAAERGAELDAALAALARHHVVQHVSPSSLSRADVAALLGDILGGDRASAVAGIVHDRTDGNPFFVTEFGRLLDAEGAHPVTVAAVPTSVNHVIQRRYRSLPEATRQLLATAAVAGRAFDLRVVHAADEGTLEQAVHDLEPALEHRLVEEATDGVTVFRFVHALVRESILDGLTGLRTAQLHLAVATAIEGSGIGTDNVDSLAEHYWKAADVGGRDAAVRTALAAAAANEQRVAYEQAERHLRRVLELVGRSPDDRHAQLTVRAQLAHLLVRQHGYQAPGLSDLLADLPVLEPDEVDDPVLVQLSHNAWILYHSGAHYDQALAIAEWILEQAATHGDHPVLLALGHFCAGASSVHRGQLDAAHRHFALGRRQVEAAPDLSAFAVTASHLAVDLPMYGALAHAASGDADLATAWSDDAIALADDLDLPFARALANTLGSWASAMLDDPERAQARATAALDVCAEHRFDQLAWVARLVRGWATARSGTPDGQAEEAEAAVRAIEAAGLLVGLPTWLGLLADVHACAGDMRRAGEHRQRARDLVDTTGEHGFDRWFALLDRRLGTPTDATTVG